MAAKKTVLDVYTFDDQTLSYKTTPKDDPKDRIEVEVGDERQGDLLPQVKIK